MSHSHKAKLQQFTIGTAAPILACTTLDFVRPMTDKQSTDSDTAALVLAVPLNSQHKDT